MQLIAVTTRGSRQSPDPGVPPTLKDLLTPNDGGCRE